jgi:hypothetical protein
MFMFLTVNKKVVDPKNRLKTEDKIIQCAHIMLEDLTILDNVIVHTNYMRSQILSHFLYAYGEAFSLDRKGVASYDNAKFYDDVRGVVKYRIGIMRGTRVENEEPAEEVNIAVEPRCIIT